MCRVLRFRLWGQALGLGSKPLLEIFMPELPEFNRSLHCCSCGNTEIMVKGFVGTLNPKTVISEHPRP